MTGSAEIASMLAACDCDRILFEPVEYRLAELDDRLDVLSMVLDVRKPVARPIYLGSGKRPKKGAPPKPTSKRATVKAARKANRKRRS